jgi:hypothetical protein
MSDKKFTVMVDDNFHFTDESERYKSGVYATYDEAVAKCKEIVDDYLISAIEPDMTAGQLLASYKMFGEDPFIIGEKSYEFSSWKYAEQKSEELINAKG